MDGQHRSQINFRQLFPANPSLAEDLCRLFMTHEIIQSNSNKTPVATATTWPYVGTFTGKDMKPIASAAINVPSTSPLLEEFRSLGRDSEYCPDYLNTTHNNMGPGRPVFKKKPKKVGVKILECVFCKNNGETPSVYASHVLKDAETRKICCPVLRAYTCPLCGAKGDTAHTIKYCPQNQEEKDSALIRPDKSLYVMNLIRNSNGRCRIKLN